MPKFKQVIFFHSEYQQQELVLPIEHFGIDIEL